MPQQTLAATRQKTQPGLLDLTDSRMIDLASGHETRMVIDAAQYDQKLPAKLFTSQALADESLESEYPPMKKLLLTLSLSLATLPVLVPCQRACRRRLAPTPQRRAGHHRRLAAAAHLHAQAACSQPTEWPRMPLLPRQLHH